MRNGARRSITTICRLPAANGSAVFLSGSTAARPSATQRISTPGATACVTRAAIALSRQPSSISTASSSKLIFATDHRGDTSQAGRSFRYCFDQSLQFSAAMRTYLDSKLLGVQIARQQHVDSTGQGEGGYLGPDTVGGPFEFGKAHGSELIDQHTRTARRRARALKYPPNLAAGKHAGQVHFFAYRDLLQQREGGDELTRPQMQPLGSLPQCGAIPLGQCEPTFQMGLGQTAHLRPCPDSGLVRGHRMKSLEASSAAGERFSKARIVAIADERF